MSGSLPPDLQGTLFRVGPAWPWGVPWSGAAGAGDAGDTDEGDDGEGGGGVAGALHAVEIRDGQAVWYQRQESEADAGVFWHAGSVLALPETGIPSQYSRFLEPEEFAGGLTVPIASHVHRQAADGGRVLFGVDDGSDEDGDGVEDGEGIFLRIGEWDAVGALRSAQSVELERSTWQHDIGVTAGHVVFIESPTARLTTSPGRAARRALRMGARGRGLGGCGGSGDGGGSAAEGAVAVRWIRLDPCLVTHVLGAYDEPDGAIVVSTSAVTAYPKRDKPSTSPSPLSACPDWRSRGSAGRWASWSAGALWASRSSGCRSTIGSSSIHGWTPTARPSSFATAIQWRPPGPPFPRRQACCQAVLNGWIVGAPRLRRSVC